MIQTILVPLDGSTLAERALPEARRLARAHNAAIVLVRVVHTTVPRDDPFVLESAVREAELYLSTVCQTLTDGAIVARTDVFVGDAAEALTLAVLVHGADVIVMSTHGRSGLGRVVLGSVAETVFEDVTVPVLLVRGPLESGAVPAGPYRKVLVPLDGTAAAEDALRHIVQLGVTRDAEVLLVRSDPVRALPAAAAVWGYASPQDFDWIEEETRERHDESIAYLEQMARDCIGARATHCYVPTGEPGDALLRIAEEQQVDLIAMAAHGRHGLDSVIHGSIARHVLRHAHVPLLLVHRSDAPVPAPWAERVGMAPLGR